MVKKLTMNVTEGDKPEHSMLSVNSNFTVTSLKEEAVKPGAFAPGFHSLLLLRYTAFYDKSFNSLTSVDRKSSVHDQIFPGDHVGFITG